MNEVIVALNRFKDGMNNLTCKVDLLTKSAEQQLSRQYLDTEAACYVLHVSERTLYKMRCDGELPFIPMRRKIIYRSCDIQKYLESRLRNPF